MPSPENRDEPEKTGSAPQGIAIREGQVAGTGNLSDDMVFPGIDSCLVCIRIGADGTRTGAHAVIFPEETAGQLSLARQCEQLNSHGPEDRLVILGCYGEWEANGYYFPENLIAFEDCLASFDPGQITIIDSDDIMRSLTQGRGAAHHIILSGTGEIKLTFTETSSKTFFGTPESVDVPASQIRSRNGDLVETWR